MVHGRRTTPFWTRAGSTSRSNRQLPEPAAGFGGHFSRFPNQRTPVFEDFRRLDRGARAQARGNRYQEATQRRAGHSPPRHLFTDCAGAPGPRGRRPGPSRPHLRRPQAGTQRFPFPVQKRIGSNQPRPGVPDHQKCGQSELRPIADQYAQPPKDLCSVGL